jgi:acetyl-CoA carboxylase biotin carboxyl carrier protein
MIDLEYLEKLLQILERSTADTIEIQKRGTSIRISKSGGGGLAGPVTYHVSPSGAHNPSPAMPAAPPAGESPAPVGGGPAAEPAVERDLIEIESPMVGTFYAQPEPGAEPYVRPGSRISSGQTLCIIEAMKIMNPLDSEVSGVIVERLVEDAQPVEFGQVLFRVDPHG